MTKSAGRLAWPLGLILILALALGVRLYRLGGQDFRADEAVSLFFATLSPTELAANLTVEPNPPLFWLLLKAWLAGGESETWLRLLPTCLGLAGMAAAMPLARRLTRSDAAGLAAGLVLALSPFHLRYSQDLRSYTLWFALSALAWLGLTRWRETGRRGGLALFALAGGLSFYSHYAAVFFLPALAFLALSWAWPDQAQLKNLGWGLGLLLLLALPGLPFCLANARLIAVDYWMPEPSLEILAWVVSYLAAPLPQASQFLAGGLAGTVLAGLAWAGLRSRDWPILLPLLLPLALALATSTIVKPILIPRTIFPALLVPAILTGLAWARPVRSRPWARLAVGAYLSLAVFGLLLYHAHPHGGGRQSPPWREATALVLARSGPEEVVVFAPDGIKYPFWWYERRAGRDLPKLGFPETQPRSGERLKMTPGWNAAEEWPRFRSRLRGYRQAWVFLPEGAAGEELLGLFASAGTWTGRWSWPGIDLARLDLTRPAPEARP